MSIVVSDGWPYVQPELVVAGLPPLEHVNAGGVVCLWPHGDAARQWVRWAGWEARIAEWVERTGQGFGPADVTMDAHRYFEHRADSLALIDLSSFAVDAADGASGLLHADLRGSDLVISAGKGSGVKGTWFFRGSIPAPPRTVTELDDLLTDAQRPLLQELLNDAHAGRRRVAVLLWEAAAAPRNGLVLEIRGVPSDGSVGRRTRGRKGRQREFIMAARAFEVAPTDPTVLQSRAGPDGARLDGYGIVIFGAGAVGSHTAVLLAESGVGKLTLVDGERLRPGNVVRHAAGRSQIGQLKPRATASVIANHAPWTQVFCVNQSSWNPDHLSELIDEHDLAIDATGVAGFSDQLAHLARQRGETIVTAALYRSGSVARICRQAPEDTALWDRGDTDRYPLIPADPEGDPLQFEAGCSAMVNLAPPKAVVACSVLAAEVAVDALMGTRLHPDEVTQVLVPLEASPFDKIGRLTSA